MTSATEVGNTRLISSGADERVAKINEISFYSLTSATWDDLQSASEALPSPSTADFADAVHSSGYHTPQQNPVFEHPCSPLAKVIVYVTLNLTSKLTILEIFSAGYFYYATEPHWDLSSRLSHRLGRSRHTSKDIASFDARFIWNEYILHGLLDFRAGLDDSERAAMDRCQFLVCTCFIMTSRHPDWTR